MKAEAPPSGGVPCVHVDMDTLISVPLGNPIRAESLLGTGVYKEQGNGLFAPLYGLDMALRDVQFRCTTYSATPRQARLLGVAGDGGTVDYSLASTIRPCSATAASVSVSSGSPSSTYGVTITLQSEIWVI